MSIKFIGYIFDDSGHWLALSIVFGAYHSTVDTYEGK